MNPLEVEKGVAAYLRELQGLPTGVQVHTSLSAEEMDLEKQAIVVQAQNSEHRGFTCSVFDLEISVRSPAIVSTLDEHSALVAFVDTAVRDQSDFITAFDEESSGMTLAGTSPPTTGTPSFNDRAWLSTLIINAGIVRT